MPQHGTDVLDAEEAHPVPDDGEQALADGYSGFRAVVDVTAVARTPEHCEGLVALEFSVDQQMALLPFSALCAHDTSQLDSAAELSCLHPFVGEAAASFHIYAEPEARFDFALTGEIDAATSDLFATTVHRLLPLTADATVQVNAEALQFIGHRQMPLLDELAEEHDRTEVLRTNQHVPARLIEVLHTARVRVEPFVPLVGDPPAPAGSVKLTNSPKVPIAQTR